MPVVTDVSVVSFGVSGALVSLVPLVSEVPVDSLLCPWCLVPVETKVFLVPLVSEVSGVLWCLMCLWRPRCLWCPWCLRCLFCS